MFENFCFIRNLSIAALLMGGISFAAPWLGVTFKRASFENHLALNVIGVHPESGCFTAGMVAGDQIVGVQGQALTDMSQIQSAIAGHKAGQKIKIEIRNEINDTILNRGKIKKVSFDKLNVVAQ